MEVKRTETFKKHLKLDRLNLHLDYTTPPSISSLETNLLFDDDVRYPVEMVNTVLELLSKFGHIKNIKLEFSNLDVSEVKTTEIENNAPDRIGVLLPHHVKEYHIFHEETINLDIETRDKKLTKCKGVTCTTFHDGTETKGELPSNIKIDIESKTALISMNPYIELQDETKYGPLSHFFWIDPRRPVFLILFNQLLLDSNVEEIIIEYFYDKEYEYQKNIPNSMEKIKKLIDEGLTKSVVLYHTEAC